MTSTSTPVRRSRRERKSNTRYDDQIAWEEALPMLRAASDSPDRSSESDSPEVIEREKDPDVNDVVMQDAEEEEFQETQMDGDLSDGAESSSANTPDEYGGEKDPYMSRLSNVPLARNKTLVPRPRAKALAAERGVRSRMLDDGDAPKLRLSKEKVYTLNFGSQLEDLYPVMRSRDVWHLNPRDVVLPSRNSITEALKLEAAGRYLPQPDIIGIPSQETTSSAEQAKISHVEEVQYQRVQALDDEEAAKQMFWTEASLNEIVLGPGYEARKHKLAPLQPTKISEIIQHREGIAASYHNGVFSVLSPPRKALKEIQVNQGLEKSPGDVPCAEVSTTISSHEGWLINLGARPQCLAWAPVRSDGQYLAIAFKCSKLQRDAASEKPSKLAPAFAPSPGYPSHIQIWRLMALPGEPVAAARFSHDPMCAPYLLQRICMKVGNVLHLEWLPVSPNAPASTRRTIAVLSSDGDIRLVTIDLATKGTFEIIQPRLEAHPPPHTVFTCFTLPSHEDLIAGGADGAIYLYNLGLSSANGELEPYCTIQIHITYIMKIVIASDLPHFLASTSASGEMMLTDLRSPHQDRVRLHKSRLPTRNLSYLPHTRMFLTTSDASGNSEPHGTSLTTVNGHNLRHFYHGTTVVRLPEASGVATVLATGLFHPIVLAANAAGCVFATNALRRLLPTPLKDEAGGGFMLKLCDVDWMPLPQGRSTGDHIAGTSEERDQANIDPRREQPAYQFVPGPAPEAESEPSKPKVDIDIFHGRDVRSGITRLHERFKPERIELSTFGQDHTGRNGRGKNKEERKAADTPSAASYQIICHEEQAVTAMAWNGNSRFAGWAAIAWGSGILRIQDLAHGD